MSGTAGVGTLFANAVTATGAQLDANFSTVVAYVNDPTNRNNYAADGAATNTVNLTFSPAVVGGYTAGLELTWKWGQTNTGAAVLNANGLGNISLVNPDGSALQSGQGVQGSIGKGVYDGTRAIFITPPSPATKAAMQTATASASFVSPAQVVNHPGVAKAWAYLIGTATGTITNGSAFLVAYNVSQAVRTGAGSYSFSLSTPMATTAFAFLVSSSSAQSAEGARSTTVVQAITQDSGGTAQDAARVSVTIFGAQ